MNQEPTAFNRGVIIYDPEHGPRVEAMIRGDSARMLRGIKLVTGASAPHILHEALSRYSALLTEEATGSPALVVHDGRMYPLLAVRELPPQEPEVIEQVALSVNLQPDHAHMLEILQDIDGTPVEDTVNLAVHSYSKIIQLAVAGAEVVGSTQSDDEPR